MKTMTKILTGALAGAMLASPVAGRAQAAPATAPATPPAGQPAADIKSSLDSVNDVNARTLDSARMALQKATSPTVKEFAQRSVTEHERLQQELAQHAAKRNIQLQQHGAISGSAGHKASVDKLLALNGAEFDRAFMETTTAYRAQLVDTLKSLRDRTPGKEAELKRWLDDAENAMEQLRNESRVAAKAVSTEQRQGRAPAK